MIEVEFGVLEVLFEFGWFWEEFRVVLKRLIVYHLDGDGELEVMIEDDYLIGNVFIEILKIVE
jgi:hypothetical protein